MQKRVIHKVRQDSMRGNVTRPITKSLNCYQAVFVGYNVRGAQSGHPVLIYKKVETRENSCVRKYVLSEVISNTLTISLQYLRCNFHCENYSKGATPLTPICIK